MLASQKPGQVNRVRIIKLGYEPIFFLIFFYLIERKDRGCYPGVALHSGFQPAKPLFDSDHKFLHTISINR